MTRPPVRAPSAGGPAGPPRLTVAGGARAVAADAVARVLDDGAYGQLALSAALSRARLDDRDKAFATELFYGTLRWAGSLEQSLVRALDKPQRGLDARAKPHLLVAAYQLQHLSERVPAHAAVDAAVESIKRVRRGLEGFANAILRRLGSPPHTALPPTAPPAAFAQALGVPPLLAEAMLKHLDASEAREALLALNARPKTYALLTGDVEAAVPHTFVPGVFALKGGAVVDVPGFVDGKVLVVDPGSACAALLACAGLPAHGGRFLDLCAAPGTKSMIAARAAGEGATIVAVEVNERRAVRIGENAARLGLKVDVKTADALTLEGEGFVAGFDAVLVDAPCSGLGTTRRRPEIKLRRVDEDIERNAQLQLQLLLKAASFVRPGGVLVYSVCSPVDREGEAVVDAALSRLKGFAREDARTALPFLPADAVDARGQLRLFPHRHDADAFFAARLRRTS